MKTSDGDAWTGDKDERKNLEWNGWKKVNKEKGKVKEWYLKSFLTARGKVRIFFV